ncbi:DNA-processing protein DprA [Clostridium folliculivorans]|uniref:DNA protecting protein DprA n=1 Tax=Clostridium folliculivorans TaxID=2886038 RepID=A0A9W6DAK3_9CLOT|nr:DNA-processing protein DprA [Clostridium folliculivorans]GKU24768.1 DNA protecting protein DprA [Clostridium folliculivorans]GKU30866.1 DNA protecting protein DprA [Clostridium folliculivorans]
MDFYKIWFSMLPINDSIKLNLLDEYIDEETIYRNINFNHYKTEKLVNSKIKNNISEEEITKLTTYIIKNNIGLVTYTEDRYPSPLRHIKDAPYCLFYKGDIDILNKKINIAVVGSRKCTSYGREATKFICRELSRYDTCIISGGAYGIDSEAHKSVIENKGVTCGVLGCGIDVIYPAYNKILYENIAVNGCLISEFLPGTKPLPYNFPRRNRIISGLSKAVIVVEANEKSGSLITANYALDQGKDVLAVPGTIYSPQSKGTNKLIRDGATSILDTITLLEGLDINMKKNKNFSDTLKAQIIRLLNDKPTHIDEIIRNTDIDTSMIYELLFEMQFNNEIMCILGNYYVKNI